MILQRIGVVLLLALLIAFEAAVVAVMKDNSKKMPNPTKAFHKWLIIWAAVNNAALIISTYIFTGRLLGVQL